MTNHQGCTILMQQFKINCYSECSSSSIHLLRLKTWSVSIKWNYQHVHHQLEVVNKTYSNHRKISNLSLIWPTKTSEAFPTLGSWFLRQTPTNAIKPRHQSLAPTVRLPAELSAHNVTAQVKAESERRPSDQRIGRIDGQNTQLVRYSSPKLNLGLPSGITFFWLHLTTLSTITYRIDSWKVTQQKWLGPSATVIGSSRFPILAGDAHASNKSERL